MSQVKDNYPFLVFGDDGWFVDDVTGMTLPREQVAEARKDEMKGFAVKQVYELRFRAECAAAGLIPIGVRWVDVLKKGKVRSRLVCQDFNPHRGKVNDNEVFAPTPPLLASRWLVSMSAST